MKKDVIKLGLLVREPYLHLIKVGEFNRGFLQEAKRSMSANNDPLILEEEGFRKRFYYLDYLVHKRRVILAGYSNSPLEENHLFFTKLVEQAEKETGNDETSIF